ncbi:MAG: hypothetical protein J6Q60_05630 [Bacteroidaceae bacterium]|nr:hypothetical protein [Bacteroidaceae bacterium]
MFIVNSDGSIHATRGDIGSFEVGIKVSESADYVFKNGDIVRFTVYERKRPDRVVLMKKVHVDSETVSVVVSLSREDTKIGDLIDKPVDYWYEVELNPDTAPQTFIGYDKDGPKIFTLFPEGADELCK